MGKVPSILQLLQGATGSLLDVRPLHYPSLPYLIFPYLTFFLLLTVQATTRNPTDSITHSKHISSALSSLYQVMNPSPENRMRDYEEDPNTPSPEQIWRLNMSPRLGGVLDPATQIVRSNHFQGACHMCVFFCCCCVARDELLRAIKPLCDIRY